jgi:anti-sigma regulatory factor (Ser/Thr protein kinase)/anti-anti-sigma regulatory factor
VSATVRVEFRGEFCVVRCSRVDEDGFAEQLRGELARCRESGARDVLLDIDSRCGLGSEAIGVVVTAAEDFRAGGGELVVAVEESKTRRAFVQAGLLRPGPREAPGDVIEHTGSAASLPERPRWQHDFYFRALTSEIPVARRRVTALAEVAGFREPELFELTVAVSEALTNAVLHGSPHKADDDVRVRFFCYDDEVAIEVVDSGAGMDAAPICSPSTTAIRGRGIHFMRALCDSVQFACGPLGTHVLMVKRRRE